jgi:hypothetical protein
MKIWFSRLRGRGLALGVLLYWIVLAVMLVPAIHAIWQATHAPNSGTGNIAANVSDGVLSLTVSLAGKTLWTGSQSLLVLLFEIFGVPVLAWLVWLSQRQPVTPELDEVA